MFHKTHGRVFGTRLSLTSLPIQAILWIYNFLLNFCQFMHFYPCLLLLLCLFFFPFYFFVLFYSKYHIYFPCLCFQGISMYKMYVDYLFSLESSVLASTESDKYLPLISFYFTLDFQISTLALFLGLFLYWRGMKNTYIQSCFIFLLLISHKIWQNVGKIQWQDVTCSDYILQWNTWFHSTLSLAVVVCKTYQYLHCSMPAHSFIELSLNRISKPHPYIKNQPTIQRKITSARNRLVSYIYFYQFLGRFHNEA